MTDTLDPPIRGRSPARRFIALIRDIHDLTATPFTPGSFDPDQPMGFELSHSGIPFILGHDPARNAGNLHLVCQMGPLPEAPAEALAASMRLLEINAQLMQQRQGMFSIEPGTKKALFSFEARLADVTAASLLDSLGQIARQARLWRTTWFLDDDPGDAASTARWTRA